MKEVWEDIQEYEGFYQVSNLGRVRSLDRTVPAKNGKIKFCKGGIKAQSENSCGYLRVMLSKNKKNTHILVHRLVAAAFLENPDNHKQVNHINGNKKDNSIDNLEWISGLENIKHSIETGLRDLKGEKNSQSKLTKKDVIEIKKRLENETLTAISKDYDISISVISKIKLGKAWKHVE